MNKHLTENQLREVMRKDCIMAGSQQNWAKTNGYSPAYVSDILKGKTISDNVAEKLGYKRVYIHE